MGKTEITLDYIQKELKKFEQSKQQEFLTEVIKNLEKLKITDYAQCESIILLSIPITDMLFSEFQSFSQIAKHDLERRGFKVEYQNDYEDQCFNLYISGWRNQIGE